MPNGIWGADTDVLREVAVEFRRRGTDVADSASGATSQVRDLEWIGDDRDRYVEQWMSTVDAALRRLADDLDRLGSTHLPVQADAQDEASGNGHGSFGGNGGDSNDVEGVEKSEGEKNAHNTRVDDEDAHRPHDGEIPTEVDDIDPYDINQQGLGDCWVLASLAAVAGNDPEFIAEHITYDPETDEYIVTLYENGEPVDVRVDNSFMTGEDGERYIYGVGDDGQPNFASIYEKALAEHYGEDYGDIWGGDPAKALETITGQKTESQSFNPNPLAFWETAASSEGIKERLDDGEHVVLSTKSDLDDDSPIVGNHAYTVVDVRDDGSVVLYNPWGSNPDSDYVEEGLEPGEIVVPADELGDYFAEMDATK